MANKTSKLTIVIAGKDQGAQKALKQTQTGVQGLGGAASAMGSQLAGAFSVGAIAAFGKKAISDASAYAGEVLKIQRLSGASAKDSSLLAFTAKNAGVEAGKAAGSYAILAKNIQNGKVAAAGIATKDSQGNLLSFGEILRNVADKIHELPPGFQRTALAMKVFGRGGADMVKILQAGSAALDENAQKLQDMGLELTDENLANYKKFAQLQRDIKGALLGVEVQIGNGVIPKLNDLSHAFGAIKNQMGPLKSIPTDFHIIGGAITNALIPTGYLSDAWDGLAGDTAPLTKTALDAVAKATKDAGIEAEDTGKKLGRLGRHYVGTSNAIKAAAAAEKSYADKKSLQNALEDVASAQDDLTAAQRASVGDSDEYRAAVQQESDDLQALAEDQAAVTAAKADAIDAQHELTEARVEAAQKVDDLRNAVVKAATAERDSIGALHDAQREAAAIAAKGDAATPAEKEHAAIALADAQDAVAQAHRDTNQAQQAANSATIEGDSGVIAAHKRVEDAQKAIGAAERKVAEDRATLTADALAKSEVLKQAAKDRKDAERKVADALFSQAEAFRQIQTDSKGPIAGLQAFADALGSIEGASPEVRMLLAQVQAIINASIVGRGPEPQKPTSHITVTHGVTIDSSHSGDPQGPPSPGSTKPGGVNLSDPGEHPRGRPRNLSGGPTINVTVNAGPTPREHARASGAAVGGAIGKLVRAGR